MVKEKTIIFFSLCFCHLVGVCAVTDELRSVMEGESVSLNTNLTEIQNGDRIKWTFGTNRNLIAIARTDGVNNTIYDDVPDERFRGRLKLDNKTGSLIIMNIRTDHTGVYEAEISTSRSSSTHRFTVTVSAAPTTDPPSTSASTSASSSRPSGSSDPPSYQTALISAAAAGFLLLIIAVVVFFICRKHRKTEPQVEPQEEEVTYADTTFHKRNAPQSVQSSAKQEEDVVYAGVVTRR